MEDPKRTLWWCIGIASVCVTGVHCWEVFLGSLTGIIDSVSWWHHLFTARGSNREDVMNVDACLPIVRMTKDVTAVDVKIELHQDLVLSALYL